MKLSFKDLLSVKFSLLNIIVILIITALIIAVLFLVYFPFGSLNLSVQQGDKYLKSEHGLKILALNDFKQAEKDWPFLRFNQPLKNKIKEAKKAIEDYKQNTAALIIFLKDADEAKIKELVNKLEKTDGVRKVKYVSQEEALKIYKERNKDNSTLLELVTSNILPASIEVFLSDWNKRDEINNKYKNSEIIESIIVTNTDKNFKLKEF